VLNSGFVVIRHPSFPGHRRRRGVRQVGALNPVVFLDSTERAASAAARSISSAPTAACGCWTPFASLRPRYLGT
jgi:hypothetical protein